MNIFILAQNIFSEAKFYQTSKTSKKVKMHFFNGNICLIRGKNDCIQMYKCNISNVQSKRPILKPYCITLIQNSLDYNGKISILCSFLCWLTTEIE